MPAKLETTSQISQHWRTSCGVAAYPHRLTIVRGRRRVTTRQCRSATAYCDPVSAIVGESLMPRMTAHNQWRLACKAQFGRCVWLSSRYCRMSACARMHGAIEGALTTKLTTYRLVGQLCRSWPYLVRHNERLMQAPEPASACRRSRARARRAARLPPQTKGVGSAFQPRAVASNQAISWSVVSGCCPARARRPKMRWIDSALLSQEPESGV